MENMDLARAAVPAANDARTAADVRSMTGHAGWLRSKAALLDIALQCKQAGIPFLVGLYSSLDGGFDPAFVTELREAGIDAIHLQPAWKDIAENRAHVSRIDSHPSSLVHQKLAEYIVNIFSQRGWLDEQ